MCTIISCVHVIVKANALRHQYCSLHPACFAGPAQVCRAPAAEHRACNVVCRAPSTKRTCQGATAAAAAAAAAASGTPTAAAIPTCTHPPWWGQCPSSFWPSCCPSQQEACRSHWHSSLCPPLFIGSNQRHSQRCLSQAHSSSCYRCPPRCSSTHGATYLQSSSRHPRARLLCARCGRGWRGSHSHEQC